MFSWLPYFTPKSFSFSNIFLLVCFREISLNLLVEFSFVLEGFVLSIILTFVDIFLVFLLSPVHSGLFSQVVLLFFLVLLFPFCPYMFQHFSFVLSFLPVFVAFLSTFPVEFPIQILILSSCSLREPLFSH